MTVNSYGVTIVEKEALIEYRIRNTNYDSDN